MLSKCIYIQIFESTIVPDCIISRELIPSLLCAGRALTGEAFVADDPTFPPVVLEETDFGMRRSGPREADRAGGRLTGWKIAPKYRTG